MKSYRFVEKCVSLMSQISKLKICRLIVSCLIQLIWLVRSCSVLAKLSLSEHQHEILCKTFLLFGTKNILMECAKRALIEGCYINLPRHISHLKILVHEI